MNKKTEANETTAVTRRRAPESKTHLLNIDVPNLKVQDRLLE